MSQKTRDYSRNPLQFVMPSSWAARPPQPQLATRFGQCSKQGPTSLTSIASSQPIKPRYKEWKRGTDSDIDQKPYPSPKNSHSFSTADTASRVPEREVNNLLSANKVLRQEIEFYTALLDQQLVAEVAQKEKEIKAIDGQIAVFQSTTRHRCIEHFRAGRRRQREGIIQLRAQLEMRFAMDEEMAERRLQSLVRRLHKDVTALTANPRAFVQAQAQTELAHLEDERRIYDILSDLKK